MKNIQSLNKQIFNLFKQSTQVQKNLGIRAFFSQSSNSQKQVQPRLFTPGPLNTSESVKLAMNYDFGSRDPQFLKIIKQVREDLLKISHVTPEEYDTVIVQGSGTFGVEATITTSVPRTNHKFLVIANGAYGERMCKIMEKQGISYTVLRYEDHQVVRPADVERVLRENKDITHVGVIHSETTSGLINPIQEIGKIVKQHNSNIVYIVDAMSSFGAYDIKVKDWGIDFLVSSSNKNLQGIPGFAYAICNLNVLKKCEGNARSLSLDMYDQWLGIKNTGQFRFTPPTHVLKAFSVALNEFNAEGGVLARNKRYVSNQKYLQGRLESLGFKLYIENEIQGCIITTFLQPVHPNWDFNDFYNSLAKQNMVIYPGKLTKANSFRIGSIGDLKHQDFVELCDSIESYLKSKQIPVPVTYK